jgi:hypothetical protein
LEAFGRPLLQEDPRKKQHLSVENQPELLSRYNNPPQESERKERLSKAHPQLPVFLRFSQQKGHKRAIEAKRTKTLHQLTWSAFRKTQNRKKN